MTKKILLIIFLVSLGMPKIYSQTVNDKPISEIDGEFAQIVGTTKRLSFKLSIDFDFGQTKSLSTKETQIKDKNGKLMEFDSMIDALNFMTKNGYDFVQAFARQVGDIYVYHYLLKKKK